MTTAIWARDNRYIKTKRKPWQTSWIFVLVFSLILMGFVYVILNAKSIQTGYQISEALQLQQELKETNHKFKSEWAHLTSPQVLSSKAKALGFTHPGKIIKIER